MKKSDSSKYFLLILVLLSKVMQTYAQEGELMAGLLFPQYEQGYVVLKEGYTKVASRLNYDTVDEQMLFIDADSTVMALDGVAVIVVVIGDRSFFPAGEKAFYEMRRIGTGEFFVRHKTKILSKGKASGYGTYSQTSSVGNLTIFSTQQGTKQLKADEQFMGVREESVFLKNGNKFERIKSLKSLNNFFKNCKKEIEDFAKLNSTNFTKLEDVKSILEYAFSLSKK
jgi:hypothetical protein